MTWKAQLDAIIDEQAAEVVALRRHLHAHPEPSGEEMQTSLHLYQLLEKQEIEVRMGPDGCGVLADGESASAGGLSSSKRIALRGDIDALHIQDAKNVSYRSCRDGIMHACGHDAHTAMVYGAICALATLGKNGHAPWPLSWRAIFQPAEETATGAARMIEAGALEGVDKIFSLHVDPARRTGEIGLRSGALTAHCDSLQLTVRGQGGHAARPHESNDPIAASAQLISTLYQFVPRATDSLDAVVLTIGRIQGGQNANVIPDRVELWGTLRTLDPQIRLRTIEQIHQVTRGIEEITGTQIEVSFHVSIPSVVNNGELTRLLWQEAEEVVGDDHVQLISRPSMGSEDFARYLEKVPGVMFRLGCASDLSTATALHTPLFDIDETALPLGTRILARAVVMASQEEAKGISVVPNSS
ncbi:MAG: amidohydrolase [Planctomycetes bacterium]|nr:amidohydrolase [Planctomycetota bacterium]